MRASILLRAPGGGGVVRILIVPRMLVRYSSEIGKCSMTAGSFDEALVEAAVEPADEESVDEAASESCGFAAGSSFFEPEQPKARVRMTMLSMRRRF